MKPINVFLGGVTVGFIAVTGYSALGYVIPTAFVAVGGAVLAVFFGISFMSTLESK